MASLSTFHLYSSSLLHRKTLQSSPKLNLSSECFSTRTWMNSSKNLSLNYQVNQKIGKLTGTRVATVDAPQQLEHDDSTAKGHDIVDIETQDPIEYIRMLLNTTGDGRISVSPYDTAWIALIKDVEGRDFPQFPSSLEWIANHQLADGSWGDEGFFCVYDRLVNTIACVVALRSWNVHHDKSQRGIQYIKENVHQLKDGNAEHMMCGFEVVFPALLQKAKNMGIDDLPYEAPVIQDIYHTREQKLKRIPLEMMHKVPTSLLFSLEGLENLDWDKLLKLQSADGSFLTSPSSTAFAFMQTKDEKCFQFIKNTVETFNGGAPHTYPVDVFGRLWAVDRLQRLGISRFFEAEIADCLSHIHRYWNDKGLFSGRESDFVDIDDTSMGFRLLRMQGYDVSPNVLRNFKNGDKFSCYGGQTIESSTPIYNLYRASQFRFPGEEILEEADKFAHEFLSEQLGNNQLLDKWVISDRLQEEISIGLGMPFYATLPRVEASYYIQHYAGADDVWIGKTLYRMPEISNDTYLELARNDFKRCQAQHQFEWIYMQEWYESCNIEEFGISRKELLRVYFLACSSIFEVERTKERMAWAKSQIISRMITSFFNKQTTSSEEKETLLTEFRNINGLHKSNNTRDGDMNIVLATLHQFFAGFDRYTSHQLKNAWGVWLSKLQRGAVDGGADAELITTTINVCAGHIALKEDILSHDEYKTLTDLTSKICQQLSHIQNEKVVEIDGGITAKSRLKNEELQRDMQSLVKLVLEKSVGLNRNIKQTFLTVAKTYYYRAYNAEETMDAHIFKVLFEPVA
uniref:Terpene synthase 1 n=1 Tax=Ajuga reptans TaxID=38596 RepID=A0A3G6V9V0_AJURE|nr:terpene synthase 1 [Ajuga reptans]